MPVRLSSSSVLVWPDRTSVESALRQWVATALPRHPEVLRLGCFGSFARSDWGTGSDLDLLAIVHSATERFDRRANAWDLTPLPVPADLVVYTEAEWDALRARGARFVQVVEREGRWLHP